MASTTRRPSGGVDRRAEVEQKVARGVAELLAEGSTFTELGVERLAGAAGISRSTFYLYFRDKSDLLQRLGAAMVADVYSDGRAWEPTGPDGGVAGLTQAYLAYLTHYRAQRALFSAIVETAAYDAGLRAWWNGQRDRFLDVVRDQLRAEQAAGRTAADLDVDRAAGIVVRGGFQVLQEQLVDGEAAADHAVAQELAANHWYGAYRRGSAS
ncbi:TetR/AcrR family transcriptional regulator [Modestobacter sp. VKM Ac-2986]|uniref:TetR/AcrR family transcriptional regulator n=1 Tax=Modestobacter sp. VKM Ac-2986 TaxID=3004140 RepID=UPI0022AB0F32|nr:TetR/AcrR family transcriptional regulator [Modestobacter sp. VKM Ac-2986]MCZ2828875.1 TetR/AcrR family transcriptional regulator [Modestobacter sp. VKM Ac-2986]